jgi:hypothetical protein
MNKKLNKVQWNLNYSNLQSCLLFNHLKENKHQLKLPQLVMNNQLNKTQKILKELKIQKSSKKLPKML